MRTAATCLVLLLAAMPAAAQGVVSIALFGGIGAGAASTSASAWSAVYAHPNRVLGVGVEAGIDGWDAGTNSYRTEMFGGGVLLGDNTLGPDQLQHLAGALELRMPGLDWSSGPYARLVMGGYRQRVQDGAGRYVSPAAGDGVVRPGGAIAFGAAGRHGLTPGAEFRVQWVSTTTGPLTTFTAAFGLGLELGRRNDTTEQLASR